MKFLDLVVDCPDCGERVALSPVYCVPKQVREPAGIYLTVEIGDIPREYHACRAGVRVVPTVVNVNESAMAGVKSRYAEQTGHRPDRERV